ncbi:MAG: hypothetical protein ABIE14_01935 [Patescibacteria group bacterium]
MEIFRSLFLALRSPAAAGRRMGQRGMAKQECEKLLAVIETEI